VRLPNNGYGAGVRSSPRSLIVIWVSILVALGLAACGGGGASTGSGGTDSAEATDASPPAAHEAEAAAVRAVEDGDAASFCRGEASAGYIRRIYGGDVGRCVSSKGSVPERPGKASARAAVLDPDEEHATVTVALSGGTLDGTAGKIEMVREGDGWKLDDYDDAFIRSAFLASIHTADEGALSTPEIKACFSHQVKGLPAATIRQITDHSDAGEKGAMDRDLVKIAENCPESALAEYGARTLTEGVEEGGKHGKGYVACLHREIKFGLEVSGITTDLLLAHPSEAAVGALEGIVEGAKGSCED
jgi:hypothetical protein